MYAAMQSYTSILGREMERRCLYWLVTIFTSWLMPAIHYARIITKKEMAKNSTKKWRTTVNWKVKMYCWVDSSSFGKHLHFEFSTENGVDELSSACAELCFQLYILGFTPSEDREPQSVGMGSHHFQFNFTFCASPLPKIGSHKVLEPRHFQFPLLKMVSINCVWFRQNCVSN